MYIDQDTFVEAEDYQIPTEAIMAPYEPEPPLVLTEEAKLRRLFDHHLKNFCDEAGYDFDTRPDLMHYINMDQLIECVLHCYIN